MPDLRIPALLLCLSLVAVPAASRAQPLPGEPSSALLVVIAYDGKKEVAYWSGPINWPPSLGPLPAYYTATRSGKEWSWSAPNVRDLKLHWEERKEGTLVSDWAVEQRANRLEASLIAHPDPPEEMASKQGQGTTGQGRGPNQTKARQASQTAQVGDTRAQAEQGFEQGAETGQLDAYEDGTGGQGERDNGGEYYGHGKRAEVVGAGRLASARIRAPARRWASTGG